MVMQQNDNEQAYNKSGAGRGRGGPCLTAAAREAAPDVPFVNAATPQPEQ